MRHLPLFLGTLASTLVLSACNGNSGPEAQTESTGGTGAIATTSSGGALSQGSSKTTLSNNSVPTGGNWGQGGAATSMPASTVSGGASQGLGGANTLPSTNVGGTASTGGSKATGGTASTGGSKATGGTASTGGSKATGGTAPTGGSKATGGTASTGGSKATGGTASTGGSKATGGTAPTGGSNATGGTASLPNVTVYLAGDSTVTNYTLTTPKDESDKEWAGWGMMLAESFNTKVSVVNKAVGGMTARHFIQAGNLDAILALLKSGDYFLFQFGTNDSNTTASYTINGVSYPYFASTTDFKTYLQTYIDGAKTKGAIPVLVTPPPRNSAYCGGGRSMAGYADAMVELGAAQKVAVINLSIKTHSYLSAICPAPASAAAETFFKVYLKSGTLTIDGTHFQEHGARTMAGFVAAGTKEVGLGLAAYLL